MVPLAYSQSPVCASAADRSALTHDDPLLWLGSSRNPRKTVSEMSSQTIDRPLKKATRKSATDELPQAPEDLAHAAIALPFTKTLIASQAAKLTRFRGFSSTDDEDIAQELTIGVYQACLKYDRSQGAIESFITTVAKNRISELARHREAKCRTPEAEAGSLNQNIDTADGPTEWVGMFDVEKHGRPRGGQRLGDIEQVALSQDIETVLDSLSDETREVARLLMHHNPAEIEKILGTTRAKVRTHIALIREHFESHDLGDYLGT